MGQCNDRREHHDDVKWLALVLRRVGILLVSEIERRYDIEPSLLSKHERERRSRGNAA